MRFALPLLLCWMLVFGLGGCCHKDPLAEKASQEAAFLGISPEVHRTLMRGSPLYRDLMENPQDYKTQTRLFLQRIETKTKPQQLQDWAKMILKEHKSDADFFLLPTNSVPSFVLKLDPPIEPRVYVVSHSYIAIDWGGGFGRWGLFVGTPNNPSGSITYAIEWVPGIYAYHSMQ